MKNTLKLIREILDQGATQYVEASLETQETKKRLESDAHRKLCLGINALEELIGEE